MNLIVAVDSNWGIGYQDRLLFRIPEDLQRFKTLTVGKTVILGRRTLETLPGGRPLRERTSIILTRSADYLADPAIICHSLAELRQILGQTPADAVFVIGGSSVFRQLLPFCRLAYVTKVAAQRPADSFFPDLDHLPGWELLEHQEYQTAAARIIGEPELCRLSYSFCLYRQIQPREWP